MVIRIFLLIGLVGCAGPAGPTAPQRYAAGLEVVGIPPSRTLTLAQGTTYVVHPRALDAAGVPIPALPVTATTDQPVIATIAGDTLIRAHGHSGFTTIRFKLRQGAAEFTDSIHLIVRPLL